MAYTFDDFVNETNLKFTDISSEEYREYHFRDHVVRIDGPVALNVSKSGGHRVFNAEGLSRYVPPGWVELVWKAKPGQPHFVA